MTCGMTLRASKRHTCNPSALWKHFFDRMPIAFLIVPVLLGTGVFSALAFASRETEDMSPAEQTKRLNTSVDSAIDFFGSC